MTNPGVEHGVTDIDQEIDDHVDRGRQQDEAQNHRDVFRPGPRSKREYPARGLSHRNPDHRAADRHVCRDLIET